MQFVEDRFYSAYVAILTALGAVLAVASLAVLSVPALYSYQEALGMPTVTLALALVQTCYGLFLYKRISFGNAWVASLYAAMIFCLSIIHLIHNTGQLNSWYLIGWLLFTFASGIYGLYGSVGASFLVTIYFVIVETGPQQSQTLDPVAIGAVIGTYFIGILGYLIWRTQYIDQESTRVQQLTGQLKTKQQQAQILIESITDGMIVVMPNGQISLMNPAAGEMTEWDVKEATGIDIKLVVKLLQEDGKDLPEGTNPFQQVFAKKEPVKDTLLLVGREGQQLTISLVVSPVISQKSDEVNGAVAIMRDISAQRAEEKRRADFISTASHEMRTPVAAIEGYLALAMNDKVSSIDAKARSYLEKAHASTQHLGKLFQDLLTSAKAEDGRLVNHPTAVEMGEYLDQLTDSLRFAAEKKGLLLDFVIGISGSNVGERVVKPLYYVHVDPDRLGEVITNLFDNAVKYTESGKISIGLTGNNEVVQLFIKDTGPGIPKDDIPHLFQKFYRVDNSSTRTIGGTGLGLFICKKIIELYKGRIWADSELGKGSTFYINLPRLTTQQAMQIQAQEAAKSPASTANTA